MAKRARLTSRRPNNRPSKPFTARSGPTPARMTIKAPTAAAAASLSGFAPPAEAVALFERGMAALQSHDYRSAAGHFQAVVGHFPAERALVERSRVYLALCQREIERRPAAPRTVEERLTAATAALNNGEDANAETLVRRVLDDSPQHELALYLLAAIEARRGARESALTLLTRAFDVSPEIRAQARHDLDFETLRDLEAFRQLLEAPVVRESQVLSNHQRRVRRARAER
jgi:tetratricopeptide (TPR) repeat protein